MHQPKKFKEYVLLYFCRICTLHTCFRASGIDTHPFFVLFCWLSFVHSTQSSLQENVTSQPKFTGKILNEAGVDLVLIKPFSLHYVNHVVLMLTSIFGYNFHKKRKKVCIKTRPTSASRSLKGQDTKPTTVKWSIT